MEVDNVEGLKVERIPEVLRRTGLTRSVLYEFLKMKKFPAPLALSVRSVGFLSHEVDAWIMERANERA